MELSPVDEFAVASGDYWGVSFQAGVIAYKQGGGATWCGGTVLPIVGVPITLSQSALFERQYAVSLSYSNLPGRRVLSYMYMDQGCYFLLVFPGIPTHSCGFPSMYT